MRFARRLFLGAIIWNSPAIAIAWEGPSESGSIIAVDISSGGVRELVPANASLPVTFGVNKGSSIIRVTWSVRTTTAAPANVRKLDFVIPSLSSAPGTSSTYKSIELKAIQSARVTRKPGPPLPEAANMWYEEPQKFRVGKLVISVMRDGETLLCIDRTSGKRLWSLNMNPTDAMLPGGPPKYEVFSTEDSVIVVSDRLGLRVIDKAAGRERIFLAYSNAGTIPNVGMLGNTLFVGPINDVGRVPY